MNGKNQWNHKMEIFSVGFSSHQTFITICNAKSVPREYKIERENHYMFISSNRSILYNITFALLCKPRKSPNGNQCFVNNIYVKWQINLSH